MNPADVEARINDFFNENYENLRYTGGHAITAYLRDQALDQVIAYYRKNKALIDKITETEVRLALPEQRTPKKEIKYTLEGVIDIVREGDETWMYDIKTHDRRAVEANSELYRRQLNVYAFIWKTLRQNGLDNTAVISTSLPHEVREAMRSGDQAALAAALEHWDPFIPLGYSEEEIDEMIADFGRTVELIEEGKFDPVRPEKLTKLEPGERNTFAARVCSNCDARFSCSSYHEYVKRSGKGKREFKDFLDLYGAEEEPDQFIASNLDQARLDLLSREEDLF